MRKHMKISSAAWIFFIRISTARFTSLPALDYLSDEIKERGPISIAAFTAKARISSQRNVSNPT